jgi:hypothetical protein
MSNLERIVNDLLNEVGCIYGPGLPPITILIPEKVLTVLQLRLLNGRRFFTQDGGLNWYPQDAIEIRTPCGTVRLVGDRTYKPETIEEVFFTPEQKGWDEHG